jgi:uncharacterized cupin superfamily protein
MPRMTLVTEHLDAFPFDTAVRALQRDEALLLSPPASPAARRMRVHEPLACVHFKPTYEDRPFGPPSGVYESDAVRVEWQAMNSRQPFYHRNTGADEISFQVAGERTLLSEWGCVDLAPGDFARLPNGVAHDNDGRRDVHLLFYVAAPMRELAPFTRQAEPRPQPFPGWRAQTLDELVTAGVGGPGTDIVMTPVDERLLLDHALGTPDRIQVLRPEAEGADTRWLYRSSLAMLGMCAAPSSTGLAYRRHLDAVEIQYQVEGQRTLVTQRGMLDLVPGDFVSIPAGVAFTSLHTQPSRHLVLATPREVPQVAQAARVASPVSAQAVAQRRGGA